MITNQYGRYDRYIAAARASPPMRTGIVDPCSADVLKSVGDLSTAGMLDPVLIGPERKIVGAARASGVSLEGLAIRFVEHSHAAAALAAELASTGFVNALMKGSLHTDELMEAVVANHDLRTERRMSHVYVMYIPTYRKLLIVTDAVINIRPDLKQKKDICQNAVDLLHALAVNNPKVAVLAAVETVNSEMPATLDAPALR